MSAHSLILIDTRAVDCVKIATDLNDIRRGSIFRKGTQTRRNAYCLPLFDDGRYTSTYRVIALCQKEKVQFNVKTLWMSVGNNSLRPTEDEVAYGSTSRGQEEYMTTKLRLEEI